MLGKIEEMSKETKDLASSTKDIRPAMATARFQPVSQRKQRGRMKKLVKLIMKQMLIAFNLLCLSGRISALLFEVKS